MQNAGPYRTEMMGMDTFCKAVEFAGSINSNVVSLSGGEPTSHPLFFEFLERLLDSRFRIINVLSNGTFVRDHEFTERFAKMVSGHHGFFLQITSIKGLYDNYDELHKPNLKAMRMFGDKLAICDSMDEIKMLPLGRACLGKWYDEAKRANAFPSCTNPSLVLAQCKELKRIGIDALMERYQRFYLPIVSWDGSIRLGESEQCKIVANISEPLEDINKKLFDFRPCGDCDSYKWHFQNPSTEQEKKVCEMLFKDN
jgi:hypothetical protein